MSRSISSKSLRVVWSSASEWEEFTVSVVVVEREEKRMSEGEGKESPGEN